MINVSVVGATGAVGKELLLLLEKSTLKINKLQLFASEKSVGKCIYFKKKPIQITPLCSTSFEKDDIVFFCSSSKVSTELVPIALRKKALVIDLSSAFRQKENIPLIVPEVNWESALGQKLIASPNCIATIISLPLSLLHQKYAIKRVIASTYQASSGGGNKLLSRLLQDTRAHLQENVKEDSIAFNAYLHNSTHDADGYSEEEKKIIFEVKKILDAPTIQISVTSVRVPVLRAHSIALNVELEKPFSLDQVQKDLQCISGLKELSNLAHAEFATSQTASQKNDVFYSRLRKDTSNANCLEMWVVGDQLLKGAALNAVQIAEKKIEKKDY
ncbi:MAG: aspartate-semialdehyde dehydrogenase [Chlamydiota bacterium]|jgi:aspartate-semialdehyde dehydrogenase